MTHASIAQRRISTPLGPLTAIRSEAGLSGLWFDAQKHHPGRIDAPRDDADPLLARVAEVLQVYFRGQALPHDLPLDPQGTDFQRQVWQTLCHIGAGQTCSYGELARRLGRPRSVRAVAAAIGRNPVSILIPCHRVLGMGGTLTGYAGGLERKSALLALEGAAFRAAA